MTKRAMRFRFYPTAAQAILLAQTFGCARVVYNHILCWRTNAYYQHQEKIGYKQANAKLTAMKKLAEFEWLNEVSCVPLQQCLRHQQTAFKNFFAGQAKYPKFKSKRHRQSIELTKSAFSCRDGKIYIAKSKEPLDVRWSRALSSEPSSITISKDAAGRYFVSCLCEFEPEKLSVTSKTVGLDVGLTHLLITDDGKKVSNPRHTRKYETKLAKAQRSLSRKKPGSANRAKARCKVARIHAKISDCRLDNLHKLSRELINENQVVCVESLKVKNMIRNPTLSKHIADASWGELTRQLAYKADWAGRELVKIDQFFPSSKRCSCCGYTNETLPLDTRSWRCPVCLSDWDRDINAARNIKAAGLAALALGDNVSRS